MSKSCPYCAQTDTRKDAYGYCKKHSCFYVSGNKEKLEQLRSKLGDRFFKPKYRRNMFDGAVYNPQREHVANIHREVQKLLGFVPLDFLVMV